MKHTAKKRNLQGFLAICALLVGPQLVWGQMGDDPLLNEANSVYESEQMNIDGTFKKKTQADKLAEMRNKLEKENEDLMKKKIEDIRMQEEQRMTNRLRNMFKNNMKIQDSVSTGQASVAKVTAPAPEEKPVSNDIRIIPEFGGTMIQSEQVDVESKMSLGLNIESMITNRVAIGVGVNYMKMNAMDTDSTQMNTYNNYNYNYNFNNWYNNQYNQGREVGYNHLTLELNSKFFMTVDTRIRPYVGLGIGYNRTNLKYEDGTQNNYNDIQFGDEEYRSNFVSGSATLGTEISFTKNIGMSLELKYAKSLTNSFGTSSNKQAQTGYGYYYNPDQEQLNKIGKDITGAHFASVNVGLVFSF